MLLRFFLDSKRSKGALKDTNSSGNSLERRGRSPFRDEKNGLELELTLNREVLHGEMVFPVISQALVERTVLFWGDIIGITSPNWLCLVQLLVSSLLLLDLLCLLLLGLFILILNFLNLGLVLIGDFFLVVLDLL